MTRRLPLLVLATGLVMVAAGAASADAPSRTAWYNAASAGPLAAPSTTAASDLRVGGAGDHPTAYAALQLGSPGTTGGTLTLAVRSGGLGTPTLVACPTRTGDWKAGGDQPFDGPGYDCAKGSVPGTLAPDGTSVSFALDGSVQSAPGLISIALAPDPAATTPFSVDLGDAAYAPAGATAGGLGAPPLQPDPAPAPGGSAAGGGTAGPGGSGTAAAGAAPAAPPTLPDGGLGTGTSPEMPAPDVASAPLPGGGGAPVDPAPQTAPQSPAEAVLPTASLAATDTGAGSVEGPRLLALVVLVAVSAGAGYAVGQQRSAPRLIGGRAKALTAGGPAAGGVAVVGAVAGRDGSPETQPRGIGRFSRMRDAAPRRLR